MSDEKIITGKISLREFLVDFFGALMPGVFFLIFIIPAFVIPLYVFFQSLVSLINKDDASFKVFITPDDLLIASNMPFFLGVALFLLFLSFGYIIGTLFYRLDTKKADYKSFLKIRKSFTKDSEMENWVVVIPGTTVKEPGKVKEIDVQYPYNNLKGYLESRGWIELAKKIPWSMADRLKDPDKIDIRSKTFINSIKIRIQFYFPEQCSSIIKNEAQIRLSSSMWFVANSLKKFSIIGFIAILFSCLIIFVSSVTTFNRVLLELIISFSLCVATWILAQKIKSSIERFLHYQRVREIFYVLDTAICASKLIDEDKIFGIRSPLNEVGK